MNMVSPLKIAVVDGAEPLYGTCTTFSCAMLANIATKRWAPEPLPAEP